MSNDVTKAQDHPVTIDEELYKMGDMGAENITAQNLLIPRLTILQALSPQLNKKKAEYIPDAEIGDFCNVATGDIFKESIDVIPCHFATAYIEWVKNRGGLAANHGDNARILEQCKRNEKFQNILPNGNIVEETAQWYCLLRDGANWQRIFFPLKATNLKHSRRWLTLVRAEILSGPKGPWRPPLFWRLWKLIIIDDSNDQGDWATFRPEKGLQSVDVDPDRGLLRACMSFYEDVRTNVVRGDIGTQDDEEKTINGTANKGPADPKDAEVPF